MPAPRILLLQDSVDRLSEFLGGAAGDEKNQRASRLAAVNAYDHLVQSTDWTYFWKVYYVNLEASYSTGTVAYDHCVTPDHEALTRTGWKRREDLQVGDEILAYDHDREVCRWEAIQDIHDFDYEGEVLEVVRKGRVVLRCTPNHRIPVWERYGRPRKFRKKFVTARELTCDHTCPIAAPLEVEDDGYLTPQLAGLLAWCVTDGTGLFNRRYHKADILQSVRANPSKCAEIESLTGTPGQPYGDDGMLRFPLLPGDRKMLRYFVAGKKDLARAVCGMGIQQAEAVVRAMLLAEASTNPKNDQKVFTQWGENKPVAEAFQIAGLLCGKASNFCEQPWRGMVRYQCTVRHSKGMKLAKQSRWVPYSGKVWCPQVPSTAWVMRCNGAVMITGNSGGTYERQLTLTSGTWPTNAVYYTIRISGVDYAVEDRKTSTILTLDVNRNPKADVSSTTYTAYRSSYTLPGDFRSMVFPTTEDSWYQYFVKPSEWLAQERLNSSGGDPIAWTILGDENLVGSMAIHVWPYPTSAQTYAFLYQRYGRKLFYTGYEAAAKTGTVSGTAAATTVTGSGTSFASDMVGSVIRFGTSSALPEGLGGLNPYKEQRVIVSVTNSSTLVVDAALANTHTSVKFRISDPIDLRPTMIPAYHRRAELECAILKRMQERENLEALYNREFILCKESESINRSMRGVEGWGDYEFDLVGDVDTDMD